MATALTDRQREAEEELKYAGSYTRGAALLRMYVAGHPRWPEELGDQWSDCDVFPAVMTQLVNSRELFAVQSRLMDEAERELLAKLPEVVTVYRGCYARNRRRFSWSLAREVASKFPTLNRFRQNGQPLLLTGEVARRHIRFVHLRREEAEVIVPARHVKVIAKEELPRSAET